MENTRPPNIITFKQWLAIKHYGELTKGFKNFNADDIDEICVYYDKDHKWIDYIERRKVEDIYPEYVMVPRFFWESHQDTIPDDFIDGINVKELISDLDVKGINIVSDNPIKVIATPRKEQLPLLEAIQDIITQKKEIHGILQASPGFGKTISSILLTGAFRTKTLIVVPNEILSDQWTQAILDFTTTDINNIGLIQGSDLSKNENEKNKQICIVKIQSMNSQIKHNSVEELINFYKDFTLVFYDEAHTSAAATSYAKTTSLLTTSNIIGLTATPYRDGLNNYLLKVSLGDLFYKSDHQNLVPDVEIHNVYTEFTEQETKRLRTIGQDFVMFLGMFSSMMKNKDLYFQYLADVVAYNHTQKHNIVILFPTIILMEKLQSEIINRHPELTSKILLLKGKTKQDAMDLVKIERKKLMIEYKAFKQDIDTRVKNKELKRKEANILIKEYRAEIDQKVDFLKEHSIEVYKDKVQASEILISNWNLLSAGFDKPSMSNLIIGATPRIGKVPTIQAIGRVTRIFEGKNQPLVQYFIPSVFIDFKSSASVILTNNIKIQYPEAKFRYIGFN